MVREEKLVNTQVRPCPKCKRKGVITSRWHLKYAHGEELPHINLIWKEQLCPITEKKFETVTVNGRPVRIVIPREEVMSKIEPLILSQFERYNQAMTRILSRDTCPTISYRDYTPSETQASKQD